MNTKLKAIIVMDSEVLSQVYNSAERAELETFVQFIRPPLTAGGLDGSDADLSQVEALFTGWGMPPFDETLLARLPACRVVFHAAGTVRPFSTPAMWRRGIRVSTAAEANAIPVAEYTLAAIIFSLKHAWARMIELRERGEYRRTDPAMPGAYGSTVGLLGLSRIGRRVAERLQAFDVKVIAYDPIIDPVIARRLKVELRSLDQVFGEADAISCHLPLLPATAELLRVEHFEAMKAGATFINTARGGVVHETGLLAVLRRRPDLFAILDVVQTEPVPTGSPLLKLPNLVLTPHLAGSLGPECRRMGRFMIAEARRYLSGESLHGEVRQVDLAFTA